MKSLAEKIPLFQNYAIWLCAEKAGAELPHVRMYLVNSSPANAGSLREINQNLGDSSFRTEMHELRETSIPNAECNLIRHDYNFDEEVLVVVTTILAKPNHDAQLEEIERRAMAMLTLCQKQHKEEGSHEDRVRVACEDFIRGLHSFEVASASTVQNILTESIATLVLEHQLESGLAVA